MVVLLAGHAPAGAPPVNHNRADVDQAAALMAAFARRTGLAPEGEQRRYLWTDAFAVCNFLGLERATGEERWRELALALVDRVHQTLGRHRDDDPRSGWLSGLPEDEGPHHPTRGGLRIGKPLPERGPDVPLDEREEWDLDGQYFHYLTQWMHALDQVSRTSGAARYHTWARELAATAHRAFTYSPGPGQAPRMYWKMSIGLERPLVPTMGQHDPLDGMVTALQLRATAAALDDAPAGPDLEQPLLAFAAMTEDQRLATPDPLGIGGLLVDAWRVEQLRRLGAPVEPVLVARLLEAARAGLDYYAERNELEAPADYRLGFRELGLAIGLEAVARMLRAHDDGDEAGIETPLEALRRHLPLGRAITAFWQDPAHRENPTWVEHLDINEVMLATALLPDGFLDLALPSQ